MTTDLKAKLSGAQWRHHRDRTITLDSGEQLEVVIRRPPPQVLMALFDAAKQAGEVDEKKEPTSEWNALRLLARMAMCCIFAPGGIRPLYDQGEVEMVVYAPWLLEMQDDVQSAISSAQTLAENAKGNSEATPT